MRKYFSVILVTACLMLPCVAQADMFVFEFNGGQSSASGILTAMSNGDGSFTAIAGHGTYTSPTYTDAAISLFPNPNAPGFAPSPLHYFAYDDQLLPSGAPGGLLDAYGLLFQLLGGTVELNVCDFSSVYHSIDRAPYHEDTGTFTLTAVPEPSTILLMGTILLGVAGALRRRLV
jgi:hypothetical protein